MSVLVYNNPRVAAEAAATLLAGDLLEHPRIVMGLEPDEALFPVFRSLMSMTEKGLLSWERAKLFLLKEFVLSGEPLKKQLQDVFSGPVDCLESILEVPPGNSADWASDCELFEDKIRKSGGLDIALVTIGEDGTVLFNAPNEEIAPVTHVEVFSGKRTVTIGTATLMTARKLLVVATGNDKAAAVHRMLKGSIDCSNPSSLLKLHGSLTVILDEAAASLI